MKGCECKSGFFALRDCDEPVARTCARCNRGVCSHHLSPASGFTECLDCWAREHDEKASQPPYDDRRAGNAPLDDDWTYGYRHRYYRDGYRPIYSGTAASAYYNSYDTRSFDDDGMSRRDYDAGEGGFGDS